MFSHLWSRNSFESLAFSPSNSQNIRFTFQFCTRKSKFLWYSDFSWGYSLSDLNHRIESTNSLKERYFPLRNDCPIVIIISWIAMIYGSKLSCLPRQTQPIMHRIPLKTEFVAGPSISCRKWWNYGSVSSQPFLADLSQKSTSFVRRKSHFTFSKRGRRCLGRHNYN